LPRKEREPWEKALTILGKSRGARLMALGIYLMVAFGIPYFTLNSVGITEPVLALLFVFGLLAFIVGLGMYTEESSPRGGRRR